MASIPTVKPQIPTVAPRTTGGITGPGKTYVTKPYQQMEETKKNVAPPSVQKPSAPLPDTSRMNPTMPSKPAKTRSALESNRMQ